MFSRTKQFFKQSNYQYVLRYCQKQSANLQNFLMSVKESPPSPCYSPLFFDNEVQKLLKKVSNIDFEKVFKPKPRGKKLRSPLYKLLTNEELKEEMEKINDKSHYLLQIPPLITVTEDKCEILDPDTSLDGYDVHHSNHVFIDLSSNSNNEERFIVVREANGILRTALKNERLRTNQIYFPIPGRDLDVPKMFEMENFMNVLMREEYEFILDRACAQFEPDDPKYHEVITLTYEAVNYLKNFNMLLSTRHFGSLVFYLITHKKIDNLLLFNFENDRLEDAFSLVQLYHIIHPNCESALSSKDKSDIDILQNFISFDSRNKDVLLRDFKSCLNRAETKKNLERATKKGHGL